MYCTTCRAKLPEEADYCPACGADLRKFRGLTPQETIRPPVPHSQAQTGLGDMATSLPPEAPAPTFGPGSVIADRYEVKRVLGVGGMGTVYHVHDRDLGDDRALKLLHPHLMASEQAVERFTAEARAALRLTHAGIVRVHDIGRRDRLHYLTMEYLEGRSLRAWMDDLSRRGRPPPSGPSSPSARRCWRPWPTRTSR